MIYKEGFTPLLDAPYKVLSSLPCKEGKKAGWRLNEGELYFMRVSGEM